MIAACDGVFVNSQTGKRLSSLHVVEPLEVIEYCALSLVFGLRLFDAYRVLNC